MRANHAISPIAAGTPAQISRHSSPLFDQSRERLKPEGRLYVMVSLDSDVDRFAALIDQAGFRARLAHERSILIELLIIYELLAR